MPNTHSRRNAIKNIVAGTAAFGTVGMLSPNAAAGQTKQKSPILKGNINHSVCRWCYESIPFEEFCVAVKGIGIPAIDLVAPPNWPLLQKYGLYSSMCYPDGASQPHGRICRNFISCQTHSPIPGCDSTDGEGGIQRCNLFQWQPARHG